MWWVVGVAVGGGTTCQRVALLDVVCICSPAQPAATSVRGGATGSAGLRSAACNGCSGCTLGRCCSPVARHAIAQAVDAVASDAALLVDALRHARIQRLQGAQGVGLDLRAWGRGGGQWGPHARAWQQGGAPEPEERGVAARRHAPVTAVLHCKHCCDVLPRAGCIRPGWWANSLCKGGGPSCHTPGAGRSRGCDLAPAGDPQPPTWMGPRYLPSPRIAVMSRSSTVTSKPRLSRPTASTRPPMPAPAITTLSGGSLRPSTGATGAGASGAATARQGCKGQREGPAAAATAAAECSGGAALPPMAAARHVAAAANCFCCCTQKRVCR